MCAGLAGAVASLGASPASTGGTPATSQPPSSVPQPTATQQPTATPNHNAGAAAYVTVVSNDSSTLSTDLKQVGTDCGSGQDLASCRSALVTVRDDSSSFLSDLDAHPAPPCMASVDKPLRAALRDVHSAAQEVIDGIDSLDVSKVKDGTATMNKATGEINTASDALDNVNCS